MMTNRIFVYVLIILGLMACDDGDLSSDIECIADSLVTVVESADFTDDCKYSLSNPSIDYLLLPTDLYDHIDAVTDGMTLTIKYIETPDVATSCTYGRVISILCLEN